MTPLDPTVSAALATNPNASGIVAAIEALGVAVEYGPSGYAVADTQVAFAQAIITGYTGSATELAQHKVEKQAQLDALLDANFDLIKFIRGGTLTTITAAQFGTFLATIANNYRLIRASIASAATVAAVNAINVNAGWPTNP